MTQRRIKNFAHKITDPTANFSRAQLDGIDYEAIYILDSTIFGGPDWGRLTFTVNGTYLNKFDFTPNPGDPAINLAGQFLSTSFTFSGSLPRDRAYFSLFWDGPADTWMGGSIPARRCTTLASITMTPPPPRCKKAA